MLYLEDYLEMIEHLPQELRDRFTEMREMDLTVQNNMDEIDERVKRFFAECKRSSSDLPAGVYAEHEAIKSEYKKTLEDADEKLHLAHQMYELVDKYLRRLDTELHKFKCELEADNKGITEVLEKRSLELDTPNSIPNVSSTQQQQQKENRYESSLSGTSFRYSRPRSEKRREVTSSASLSLGSSGATVVATQYVPSAYTEKRQTPVSVSHVDVRHSSAPVVNPSAVNNQQSNMAYSLGVGAGPAIAAAASQAIAATQQMQQGRRTASLKASYEAINTGAHGHEFSIGRDLAGAAQTALQAIQQDNKKKHKKWNSSSSSTNASSNSAIINSGGVGAGLNVGSATGTGSGVAVGGLGVSVVGGNISTNVGGGAMSSAVNAVTSAVISNATVVSQSNEQLNASNSSQEADATDADWTYDPNEPRYCLCNQVSYGDMVACDNEECPMEWFHYPCVGITAPPKGKWYCPQCTASMKRRRKN